MKDSLKRRVWRQALVAVSVILVLSSASLWIYVKLSEADRWVDHTHEVLNELNLLRTSLVDAETGQRGFLLTSKPAYLAPYEDALVEIPQRLDKLTSLTSNNPVAQSHLKRLRQLIDHRFELLALSIDHEKQGRHEAGLAIVLEGRSKQLMDGIRGRLEEFADVERTLLAQRHSVAHTTQMWLLTITSAGAVLGALVILLFARNTVTRIENPIRALLEGTQAFASGKLDQSISAQDDDELGELARSFNEMARSHAQTQRVRQHAEDELLYANDTLILRSAELQQRNDSVEMLGKMAHRLQTSKSDDEFAEVVRCFVPQIIPGIPGSLYLLNNSRNLLVSVASWGEPQNASSHFAPDACWGLRRGQTHCVDGEHGDVRCAHVEQSQRYTCRPLSAQGDIIGLIYFESVVPDGVTDPLSILCENVALALVNNRLRASLREQSIRDPLTGLFNRRYMDEALLLELARANRTQAPLSVIMFDVDHFKRFNDSFGHDAGDALLKAIGQTVSAVFRDGDVSCRYGGEEFLIILPGVTEAQAVDRAQALRQHIKGLNVTHQGQPLSQVTISLGVASFPDAGNTPEALIKQADAYLYEAKRSGRDRVISARSELAPSPG